MASVTGSGELADAAWAAIPWGGGSDPDEGRGYVPPEVGVELCEGECGRAFDADHPDCPRAAWGWRCRPCALLERGGR